MRRRLLFLCHRIPYPPNKGEKIRAWHMLDHLTREWDVDLACLVDDPADLEQLPFLRARCNEVEVASVTRGWRAALRALPHLRPGDPLTLAWFHHAGLRRWVAQGLAARRYDTVFVYSSAMAPYVMGRAWRPGPRRVLDLVDIDSEKWRAYAADAGPPMRQLWAREAQTLLVFERRAVMEFDASFFVSRQEAARFAELAPETAPLVDWVENGVDMARFDPAKRGANPYRPGMPHLVFTGTMGYRPNIEAACWFAREVMPRLRERHLRAPEFHIVGADPAPAVRALATLPGVNVWGTVPDMRPYIAHATAVVAPLHIARGIQNKVLEAMAMARPVVATSAAFEGIHARPGQDILLADTIEETVDRVGEILAGAYPFLGAAGQRAVREGHDWPAALQRLDRMLEAPAQEARQPLMGAMG